MNFYKIDVEYATRGEFHGIIFCMRYINAALQLTQKLIIIPHILKQAKANKFAARSCCYYKFPLEHMNKTYVSSNQLADSFFAPLNYATRK
ncbi:hypothetical protein [uncultured Chryseobacterium sp.]|uniref:hypothetical protein n=1 Tax=uncultured Chryseobacterium sp. TaxID=259322 RepID=UPI0025F19D65|nr:hypothetical protein [uncultured Chryseobacterium sp.]